MIPGLSVVWVIVFVLLLSILLDRLLFKPITRVMSEREARVKTAIDLAARTTERAKSATAAFTEQTTAAQMTVYRQMDEMRRAALQRRSEVIGVTRAEIEASVAEARTKIENQTEAARVQLSRDADALADAVASRVLGRSVS